MIRYLLDTNIVIAILNRRSDVATARLAIDRPQVAASTIVLHELTFGAYKSAQPIANLRRLHDLGLDMVAFDQADAMIAGQLRVTLARAGTPIGPYDVLIAGQALARGLTLVTNNTREFARVEGLRLEDWTSG